MPVPRHWFPGARGGQALYSFRNATNLNYFGLPRDSIARLTAVGYGSVVGDEFYPVKQHYFLVLQMDAIAKLCNAKD